MLRVAVIGAGAAGLCCARYLRHHADRFTFTVFEKAGEVGGTWVYTDRTDRDEYGLPIHSSMNASLRFVCILKVYAGIFLRLHCNNSYQKNAISN